ncbi:insulinase family protein [Vibrio sp. M260118]|uniref:insulinase family protein n=1 Tax=Vibrio sp. M260118 TaxID=3020896 RepID=UPI002F3EC465
MIPFFVHAVVATALFFPAITCAENQSALWFKHTDIQLPTNTKVVQLNNGLRVIALPTSRSSDQLSLRVRIGSGIAQQHIEQPLADNAALSTIKDTDWHAVIELNQTVFSLDLVSKNGLAFESHLAAIRYGLEHNLTESVFKQKYYVPNNTTVIVTGGIDVRHTIDAVKQQFADWQASQVQHQVHNNSFDLSGYLTGSRESDNELVVSALTPLEEAIDSKRQRRQQLLATMSNAILEQRIQTALEREELNADLSVSNSPLFNQGVLSQIRVSNIPAGAKTHIEIVIGKEIKRAIASGFSRTEYEQAVNQLREQILRKTRSQNEHYASEQADDLVEAIALGLVYTDPSYDLDLLNFHVAHLSEFDVSDKCHETWSKLSNTYL